MHPHRSLVWPYVENHVRALRVIAIPAIAKRAIILVISDINEHIVPSLSPMHIRVGAANIDTSRRRTMIALMVADCLFATSCRGRMLRKWIPWTSWRSFTRLLLLLLRPDNPPFVDVQIRHCNLEILLIIFKPHEPVPRIQPRR